MYLTDALRQKDDHVDGIVREYDILLKYKVILALHSSLLYQDELILCNTVIVIIVIMS